MPEVDPVEVRLTPASGGLYESYYFRGTRPDGSTAFWLKHNLLRYRNASKVRLDCALIIFDRARNLVSAAHDEEELDATQYATLAQARGWEALAYRSPRGSRFEITPQRLQGALPNATWALTLQRSNETLFHFTPPVLYRIGWPKKKVLTRDVRVTFDGELVIGSERITGPFVGMNGHNWGTEHAHRYAYANCQVWKDGSDAIFDGFTAKVRLAPGLTSPYVTIASLKAGGTWHHFNRLAAVPWSRVAHLSDYRWTFSAQNQTHRLEADVDGSDPTTRPWVALNYHHPSRAQSVVKNTKFASGTIRLIERVRAHSSTSSAQTSSNLKPYWKRMPPIQGKSGLPSRSCRPAPAFATWLRRGCLRLLGSEGWSG